MANTVTSSEVQKAAKELAGMRASLRDWLKYRLLNDQVLAGGKTDLRVPVPYAQRMIAATRDMAIEQDLATKLHVLLSEVMADAQLPDPNVNNNPQAAVQLAQIALVGASPIAASKGAIGNVGVTHPWLWPVLIVGGLLLVITTAIKTQADVAKERERLACIKAGACTDFGFFLKIGGIAAVAYVVWNQFGGKEFAHGLLRKRRD